MAIDLLVSARYLFNRTKLGYAAQETSLLQYRRTIADTDAIAFIHSVCYRRHEKVESTIVRRVRFGKHASEFIVRNLCCIQRSRD